MRQSLSLNTTVEQREAQGRRRNAERTVLAMLVQSFALFGVKYGLDPRELCEAAGVNPADLVDSDRQVPHAWFFGVRKALIERLPDKLVSVELGTFVTPDQMGYIGQAIKHAPNGFELIRLLIRGLSLLDSVYERHPIRFEVADGEARLRVSAAALGPPDPPECVESLFATLVFNLGALTDARPVARSVCFAHERSPSVQRKLRDFFGCPVQFGQDEHLVTLELRALKAPNVHANSEASRHFEEQVNRLLIARQEPFVTTVERRLAALLSSGAFSQDAIARAMGMSGRSLQRRLQEHGVTYNGLLSRTRRTLAEGMLSNGRTAVYEVAFALGYDDVSSFHRAFRAWTGLTPKAWRAKRQ